MLPDHPRLRDLRHVPRRFVQARDRRTFAAIGAWALTLGILLLLDQSADSGVWLADLWPAMLVLGGTLTLIFAVHLSSFTVRGLSNALLVVACAGRGMASMLGVVNDEYLGSTYRALAEMAVFTMVGYLLYITWRTRIPYADDRLID